MNDKTQQLIDRLVTGLEPVQRMRRPLHRAAGVLTGMALLAVAIALFAVDFGHVRQRAGEVSVVLELLSTALTAVMMVLAAFHLSVPGSSPKWLLAPLPPLLLWLMASAYICIAHPYSTRLDIPDEVVGIGCFVFIVLIGTPIGAILLRSLLCARPLAANVITVAAALAASAFAAFLLELLHGGQEIRRDILMHWGAVVVVILSGTVASRLFLCFERSGRMPDTT